MRNLIIIVYSILFASCSLKEVKRTQPIIEIKITASQEVLLNGKTVALEDISKKILSITAHDTVNDARYYKIRFDIDKDVDANTVMDVKQEVRKGNVRRIEFK